MTTFEEFVDPGSELLSKSALHACSDGRNALGALLTEGLLQNKTCRFTIHLRSSSLKSRAPPCA